MRTKDIKKIVLALPLAGLLGIGSVAIAEPQRWSSEPRHSETDMSSRDQRSFEDYLNTHWQTAQQLYQDPELIRSRQFVRDNESLDDWLAAHPDAADALRDHPQKYLWRERAARYEDERPERSTRMRERDLQSFENVLDHNPETARQLYADPDLINDRQFVRNSDELRNWLEDNPEAARSLRANPHKYLWRERSVSPADFLGQLLQPAR